MSKKCDGCVWFLKMKSLGESQALCTYWDGRVYSGASGEKCEGYKRPPYERKKYKATFY